MTDAVVDQLAIDNLPLNIQEYLFNLIQESLQHPKILTLFIKKKPKLLNWKTSQDNAKLNKQIEQFLKEKVKSLKASIATQLKEINGVQFLATQVDLNPEGAKDLAYELGTLGTNLFLVLATIDEDKPMLSCYISKELVASKNLNAGTVVRELGKYIQGGGGGQPFFATAGGKNPIGVKEALEKAIEFIK